MHFWPNPKNSFCGREESRSTVPSPSFGGLHKRISHVNWSASGVNLLTCWMSLCFNAGAAALIRVEIRSALGLNLFTMFFVGLKLSFFHAILQKARLLAVSSPLEPLPEGGLLTFKRSGPGSEDGESATALFWFSFSFGFQMQSDERSLVNLEDSGTTVPREALVRGVSCFITWSAEVESSAIIGRLGPDRATTRCLPVGWSFFNRFSPCQFICPCKPPLHNLGITSETMKKKKKTTY